VNSLSEKTLIEKIYSAFFEQKLPEDLILVLLWLTANMVVIYVPFLNNTPLRVFLALPMVLFIPGYCLVVTLFPKKSDIDFIERIAISFGLSIAVVPLIGLGLNFTSRGLWLNSIVISLTFFTLMLILVAHYVRSLLPIEEQFTIELSEIAGTIKKGIFPSKTKSDRVLSIVLALVMLIVISTILYSISVPKQGERFTEFFILGENQRVADYPNQIITGLDYPMYISVGNNEYRTISYTIETWIMRTEFDSVTNTTAVMEMDPIDRLSLTVAHNETMIIPYNLSVKNIGYNRVEFLLFNDNVPGPEVTGSDRINASYRNLHLGVSVV
jgi:uncharacterized membrane protein